VVARINVKGMSEVRRARKTYDDNFNALIAKPFNLSNKDHIAALNKYMDEFECYKNTMYVYQAASEIFNYSAGGWLFSWLISIPTFLSSSCFVLACIGAAGVKLESKSILDFDSELQKMEMLYNWVLKKGSADYVEGTDNTAKLEQLEIQRLVLLIAPLCETEFLRVWPAETTVQTDNTNELAKAFMSGINAISAGINLITRSKQTVEQLKLKDLKVAVEQRQLDTGVIKSLEQAGRYFAMSPEFKTRVNVQIGLFKRYVPPVILSMLPDFSLSTDSPKA